MTYRELTRKLRNWIVNSADKARVITKSGKTTVHARLRRYHIGEVEI